MDRRVLLAAATALVAPRRSLAQAWPSRPIRIVVPFTPGGSNDVLGRTLAEHLPARWGQPVTVENRPGANGNIGAAVVARAPADGHTWLIVPKAILTVNPHILPASPDPLRDFAYVARLAFAPVVLVVSASLPVRDLAALLALARERPGTISYPSSGIGSFQHLAMARLGAGTMTHVPYRGANEFMPDLLAGRVQAVASAQNSLLPHIRSGAVRPIAALHATRLPALPDLPTVAEAGSPGGEFETWTGVALPAGAPRAVVDAAWEGIAEVFRRPEIVARLAGDGIEVALQGPDAVEATIRAGYAEDGDLIRRLGIPRE